MGRRQGYRRDQKSWLSPNDSWSDWYLYTTDRDGHIRGARWLEKNEDVFEVRLPPNASNNQIFEQLLKGGHIVRRHQRSDYTFEHVDVASPDGRGIYVYLRGRPEYLMVRL